MKFDVVRAWKDEDYRLSLSDEERSSLPANPVGELELTDADLEVVYGGWSRRSRNSGGGGGNSNVCSIVCISFQCHSFGCF